MTYPEEEEDHTTQIKTLPKLMEAFMQDFEWKLYSTGGELSLKKTLWYMIAWIRKDTGEFRMANIEEAPGDITLTSGRD